jgi:hypothetical protein
MSENTQQHGINAGPRPISAIAADIRAEWTRGGKKVNFAAVPYLDAMDDLNAITDTYGVDTGEYVVRYFLVNASQFKGARARQLKEELRALLPKRSAK